MMRDEMTFTCTRALSSERRYAKTFSRIVGVPSLTTFDFVGGSKIESRCSTIGFVLTRIRWVQCETCATPLVCDRSASATTLFCTLGKETNGSTIPTESIPVARNRNDTAFVVPSFRKPAPSSVRVGLKLHSGLLQ